MLLVIFTIKNDGIKNDCKVIVDYSVQDFFAPYYTDKTLDMLIKSVLLFTGKRFKIFVFLFVFSL